MAASQELLRRAQTGNASPTELREAQQVAPAPELKDAFANAASALEGGLNLGRGGEVFRDVSALRPDSARLKDPKAIPEKFLGDLRLIEHQLLQHPGLTRTQKAERLFQFFTAYAERFQQLAQNPNAQTAHAASAPSDTMSAGEWTRTMGQFDKALKQAGFEQLRTDDGRTGFEAARQMIEAKTAELQNQVRPQGVDAPTWSDNPKPEPKIDGETAKLAGMALHTPTLQAQARLTSQRTDQKPEEEDEKKKKDTSGVLGGNAVWNVMHLLRGDDLHDVERKEAMNQLAISAALILVFGAIVAVVLVLT